MPKINAELRRQVKGLKNTDSRLPGYVADSILPSLVENIDDGTGELIRHFHVTGTDSGDEVEFVHKAIFNGLIAETIKQLRKQQIK